MAVAAAPFGRAGTVPRLADRWRGSGRGAGRRSDIALDIACRAHRETLWVTGRGFGRRTIAAAAEMTRAGALRGAGARAARRAT